MRLRIAVLARSPVAGQVKTRLIPRLGAAGAARLQAALTRRALQRACALPDANVVLWVAGPIDHAFIVQCQCDWPIEVRAQPDGDLGVRMLAAIEDGAINEAAVLVIGTDCPAQTSADLAAARLALAEHELVVQPAHDGGYVLIGMREARPEIFSDIAWGSAQVLAVTMARARAASPFFTSRPNSEK